MVVERDIEMSIKVAVYLKMEVIYTPACPSEPVRPLFSTPQKEEYLCICESDNAMLCEDVFHFPSWQSYETEN